MEECITLMEIVRSRLDVDSIVMLLLDSVEGMEEWVAPSTEELRRTLADSTAAVCTGKFDRLKHFGAREDARPSFAPRVTERH